MIPCVPLGELCDIVVGRTPARANPAYWGPGEPWLSITDMNQGSDIATTREQITATGAAKGKRVFPGTVLLSFKLSIGKVGIARVPLFTNEAIAALPIKDPARLDSGYLVRALAAVDWRGRSNRAAMGVVLNKAKLQTIPIPLPPIEEQRRIAAILDQADAIRTKRRQVLAHLDALTQSTFHALFGDPTGGDWELAPLGEVVERIDNGASPNCEARPARPDEWGVLKLGAVTYGTFRAGENKAYLGQLGGMSLNEVRPGDVLMTRKNTRELVGAVAVVDDVRPRLLLPDLIFRLELDRARVDPRYFQAMMMSERVRAAVRGLSSGSAASMPNISKARLRTLTIGLPPIRLQRQFDSRVAAINAQRALIGHARAADDELFASLQSRAFGGEL
ncbi:restriction endonuclease subunit S [Cellulomonas sp. P22]|uniref:restriction endonuclease subunit S n=1 Tax=Cellulomonas sp. P22 TaxID=3373189 RepID=UPI0037994169